VVAAPAVFLAGVAGGAFLQDPGILSPAELHHLPVGLFMRAERHVLAFQETIRRPAGGANLFAVFQGIHEDLLL
jgi:hypothetical protein